VSGRAVATTALLVAALVCAYLAWGALRNLFLEHPDSPVAVYMLLGGFWLVVALLLVVMAGRLHRRP
jgi:hypothetical protein